MKIILVVFFIVVGVGCRNEVVKDNIDDYYELISDAEFHESQTHIIKYYDFMISDRQGLCMYQRKDSSVVILDSLRAVKLSLKMYLYEQRKADSLQKLVNYFNSKNSYIHQ